jgi:hypothetical protein
VQAFGVPRSNDRSGTAIGQHSWRVRFGREIQPSDSRCYAGRVPPNLLARVAWVASTTAACGNSGGATQQDASPATTRGDAKATLPLDAACSDTQTDPRNCGACGRDCHGGACRFGACVPLGAGVLASGQHTPVGIALDATNVYWMNRGTYSPLTGSYTGAQLMKCAKGGCGNAPTVLAAGPWNGTTRLAVNGSSVYWAADNLLLRCATDGCTARGPTVLWAGSLVPTDIAVGATTIYFGDLNSGRLLTCPLDGCGMGPSSLWRSAESVTIAIALDGANVYFAISGVLLLSCGPSGCSSGVKFVGGTPCAIALDGTNVYLGNQSAAAQASIASCREADCLAGLTFLVENLTFCAGIAVDAANFYFTDWGTTEVEAGLVPVGAGRVAKCNTAGCNGVPTPLADYVTFPQQIAVDGTNVYWTDFGSNADPHASDDGRVMAMPK